MLFYKTKKILQENKVIFIAAFLALFLFSPIAGRSAGEGTLVINVSPSDISTTAYLTADPGNPILISNGVGTKINIPEGTYTLTFEDVGASGTYIKPKDRQVSITDGVTTTVNVTYFKPSNIKGIGQTTAEALLFTPSASVVEPQYSLTKGVAAVTSDGNHWQYSAAELFVKGTTPVEITTFVKSDGTSVIPAGFSSEYTMTFNAGGGACNYYNATVTDQIKTNPPSEISKIQVIGATVEPDNDGDSGNNNAYTIAPNYNARSVVYALNNRWCANDYKLKLKISVDSAIAPNTSITNTAVIDIGGTTKTAEDIDIVGSPFLRETEGGGIYSEGAIRLQGTDNAVYIIGARGDIQKAQSRANWKVGQYEVRTESTSAFSISNCQSNSACGIMNDNIKRAVAGKGKEFNNSVSNPLKFAAIPEGDVKYYVGNTTIGSGLGTDVIINGKGTIVVENGNLTINDNLVYADTKSILGVIVKNGNVIVSKNVANIVGIYYIFADSSTGGQFIVQTKSPNYDSPLTIKGLVIASGSLVGSGSTAIRANAFVLLRNYIGDLSIIDKDKPETWAPAEVFKYDGRVILNPPPAFSSQVFQIRD